MKFGSGRSGPLRDSRAKGAFGPRRPYTEQQCRCSCRTSAVYRRPLRPESAPSTDLSCHQECVRQRTEAGPGSVCCWRIAGWPELSSIRAGPRRAPPLSEDARRPGLHSRGSCEFRDDTRRFRYYARTFDTRKIYPLCPLFKVRYEHHLVPNGESLVIRARKAQHWDVFLGYSENRERSAPQRPPRGAPYHKKPKQQQNRNSMHGEANLFDPYRRQFLLTASCPAIGPPLLPPLQAAVRRRSPRKTRTSHLHTGSIPDGVSARARSGVSVGPPTCTLPTRMAARLSRCFAITSRIAIRFLPISTAFACTVIFKLATDRISIHVLAQIQERYRCSPKLLEAV